MGREDLAVFLKSGARLVLCPRDGEVLGSAIHCVSNGRASGS